LAWYAYQRLIAETAPATAALEGELADAPAGVRAYTFTRHDDASVVTIAWSESGSASAALPCRLDHARITTLVPSDRGALEEDGTEQKPPVLPTVRGASAVLFQGCVCSPAPLIKRRRWGGEAVSASDRGGRICLPPKKTTPTVSADIVGGNGRCQEDTAECANGTATVELGADPVYVRPEG